MQVNKISKKKKLFVMKKVVSSVCGFIILSAFAFHAKAQTGEWKLDLNYNYSIPVGKFKNDIISNASPRGFNAAFMYHINNTWSAGLNAGYQDYYQKYPRDVYQTGQHEVTSAVLSNSIQTMPVLLKGKFSPLSGTAAPVKPYISAAAGVSIVEFSQYLGEFGNTTNDAGLTAQGGIGLIIPFGRHSMSGLNIGADYNYIRYNKYGYNNLNNVGLHAGVTFPVR
jgi:Outer membrane protein beta-barrel domain